MPAPFELPVGSRSWFVSLAALTTVVALSIDSSLPAQPAIARAFGATPDTAQLTLSLFIVGFAPAQLVAGYFSDSWGRRPVLLGGLALFTFTSFLCTWSGSMETLLAARFLQGVSAGAAPVVARAMVRDTQPTREAARLLSGMVAILAIAPMIAPVFGGWILSLWDFRAIFVSLALFGLLLGALSFFCLSETLDLERRAPPSPLGLLRAFVRFFRTPGTRLPVALSCLSFGGQFAFVSASPFVLIDGYGVDPDRYGYFFAVTALALMGGSALGSRLLGRGARPEGILKLGSALLAAGGILVALGVQVEAWGVYGLVAPLLVYFVGCGLAGPSAGALAMEPVPEIAGTASAAVGFTMMLSGALSGYWTTRWGGEEPFVLAGVVLTAGVLSGISALFAGARAPRAQAP